MAQVIVNALLPQYSCLEFPVRSSSMSLTICMRERLYFLRKSWKHFSRHVSILGLMELRDRDREIINLNPGLPLMNQRYTKLIY